MVEGIISDGVTDIEKKTVDPSLISSILTSQLYSNPYIFPHARGAPECDVSAAGASRTIPACAGSTPPFRGPDGARRTIPACAGSTLNDLQLYQRAAPISFTSEKKTKLPNKKIWPNRHGASGQSRLA
jgi:hypothetical protein